MSSKLYSLGKWAFQARKFVLLLWILLLAGFGALAFGVGKGLDNSITIPGTESQVALTSLENTFPEAIGTSARVTVIAPNGQTVNTPEIQRIANEFTTKFESVNDVSSVMSPFIVDPELSVDGLLSEDGRAALINVQLDGSSFDISEETKEALISVANDFAAALPDGYESSIGGELYSTEIPAVTATELIGVIVALIVLVLTFGSLLVAGLPLITAIIGVGISITLIFAATSISTIMSTTPLLALMLGLAVGIDYALFIISRHQDQVRAGIDPHESAGRAIATSGSAVIFAGLTVIIALLGLGVAGIPFLTTMGIWAAVAVALAVLVSLTFTPAMLGFLGHRVVGNRWKKRHDKQSNHNTAGPAKHLAAHTATPSTTEGSGKHEATQGSATFFTGWVNTAIKKPILTIVAVVLGLGALSIPALDLKLALPDAGGLPATSQARINYDQLTEHFGPGFNGPLILTGSIVSSTDPLGLMADLKAEVEKLPGVESVPLATPNRNADTGIVQIVPKGSPDSEETKALVHDLRDMKPYFAEKYGFELSVTGFTAVGIDVSEKLGTALLPFGLIVVGLSLVLLAIVFRSVWVPVKATIGYLLSIGSAMGVVSLVFGAGVFADVLNVARTGPVISFMPIILMGVLFGLAMDYEMFLVSRMREHFVRTGKALESIRTGFVGSAKVVTAAAVIMIAVFIAFVPQGDVNIKPIALGLAVGVFVDAFLVRMTLTPAIMALLGDHAWWIPRWLDKLLPHFDVEGEGIHQELELTDWPAESGLIIAAEDLHLSDLRTNFPPILDGVSFTVPEGTNLIVDGNSPTEHALGLMIAGRLKQEGGRLKVLGLAQPMRANELRHRVAHISFRRHREDTDVVNSTRSELHDLQHLDKELKRKPKLVVLELGAEPSPHTVTELRKHIAKTLKRDDTRFVFVADAHVAHEVLGSHPRNTLRLHNEFTPVTSNANNQTIRGS